MCHVWFFGSFFYCQRLKFDRYLLKSLTLAPHCCIAPVGMALTEISLREFALLFLLCLSLLSNNFTNNVKMQHGWNSSLTASHFCFWKIETMNSVRQFSGNKSNRCVQLIKCQMSYQDAFCSFYEELMLGRINKKAKLKDINSCFMLPETNQYLQISEFFLIFFFQSSKRTLRSNEIELPSNGLLDTELELTFSLQVTMNLNEWKSLANEMRKILLCFSTLTFWSAKATYFISCCNVAKSTKTAQFSASRLWLWALSTCHK